MDNAFDTRLFNGAGGLAFLIASVVSWPALTAEPEEAQLLGNVRQLTFEGRRAGEGYFSRDGSLMVFQSERDPATRSTRSI